MYTESLKELSQYTQNMDFVKILLDESEEEISNVVDLFKRLKSKNDQSEREQLIKYYLNNKTETIKEQIVGLICGENLLKFDVKDQIKLIEYYKNNHTLEIYVLILKLSRYFSANDILELLSYYNPYKTIEIFEVLNNENILEKRNKDEIIKLIGLFQEKEKLEKSTISVLIRHKGIIDNFSCDDQIKLINKMIKVSDINDARFITNHILFSSIITENFSVEEIFVLVDKFLEFNNVNLIHIISDEDIIKNRIFSEIITLIDLYIKNTSKEVKALIRDEDILKNLNIEEQVKLINLYIENKDVTDLMSKMLDSDNLNIITPSEYFKEIYEHIYRFRNTYYAKEAITKIDNIDDFIKCLERDDIKEINSNTKIYCYMKEDKK